MLELISWYHFKVSEIGHYICNSVQTCRQAVIQQKSSKKTNALFESLLIYWLFY